MISLSQVRLQLAHVVFALLLAMTAHVPLSFSQASLGGPSFPLKLSADGRYVVDQKNRPFFMNGDTGWSLIVQLSQTDADAYLSDRALKGFNLVLVNLIERKFAERPC